MQKLEILAPCGNADMFEAALAAGADAIYLGGTIGSARAYANNFTIEELKKAVKRAHLYQMKVYLTLNTLVKEHEMEEILAFAHQAYLADVDAIILQDIGLAYTLRRLYPLLDLHASTQMNLSSLEGVTHAQEMGMSRVILARETSIPEIERIHAAVMMELELFVHGSLCVSHSGQCFVSGMIGGRSGNRGRCAQVCRKTYHVTRGNHEFTDAFLSLRDLNTLERLDDIRDLGITSLKIEGRMKKPAYVYGAVKAIRDTLNGESTTKAFTDLSSRAFSEGFTFGSFGDAVSQTENTAKGSPVGKVVKSPSVGILFSEDVYAKDALHIRTEKDKVLPYTIKEDARKGSFIPLEGMRDAKIGQQVHRVYSEYVEQAMASDMQVQKKLYSMDMHFEGKLGEVPRLTVYGGGYESLVFGKTPITEAQKRPVDQETVRERLEKVGDTPFWVDKIQIDLDDNVFFPLKEIGEIRREAIEVIADTIALKYDREPEPQPPLLPRRFEKTERTMLTVEIEHNHILNGVDLTGVDRIYTNDTTDIEQYKKQWNVPVYYALPPVFLEPERETWLATDFSAFDGYLVKDTASMHQAQKTMEPIVSDYGVHVMNGHAADYLLTQDRLESYTASIELSCEEMQTMEFVRQGEIIAFGPMPVMTLKHCPFSTIKGCIDESGCHKCNFAKGEYLTDEKQASYFVVRKHGASFMYFHQCLNRIDVCADAELTPRAYRLRLFEDPQNSAIIAYAKQRLIDGQKGDAPVWNDYWKTSGYTKGVGVKGVE